jgi:hypothetical protein
MTLTPDEVALFGREKGCWCAKVIPGFVNGRAPSLFMPVDHLAPDAKVWANNYGETDFRHYHGTDKVQVLLTDNIAGGDPNFYQEPFMKLTNFIDSRADKVGPSGNVTPGRVPIFFRYQGAKKKEEITDGLDAFFNLFNSLGGLGDIGFLPSAGEDLLFQILNGWAPSFQLGSDDLPYGNRYLLSCDFVVQIDRPHTEQFFMYDEFGIRRYAGFQIVPPDINVYSCRLYHMDRYVLPDPPDRSQVLNGDYSEPQTDEIVIATLWFLSSNYIDQPVTPDGSWMVMPEHNAFWNMSYTAQEIIDPFHPDRDLDFFKQIGAVLAGGVAYLFLATTADMLEANMDMAATILNQTRVITRFWTS